MPQQPHARDVWHLLLTIDYRRIHAGEVEAPWVNPSQLDLSRLQEALKQAIGTPGVTIRVPSDIIDVLTIQDRNAKYDGMDASSLRCTDFASALLHETRRQQGAIIDVSEAWAPFHAKADRSRVPPPVVVAMVVEADSDEALDNASLVAKSALQVESPYARMVRAFNGESPAAVRQEGEGELPAALRAELESLFGIDYDPCVLLDFPMAPPGPPQG